MFLLHFTNNQLKEKKYLEMFLFFSTESYNLIFYNNYISNGMNFVFSDTL